ncbi:hypothetical protein [Actinophytocola gossypii]|uniref:hypothetical protein n=1 Tax=Actinophytocola gossypii TaxID=2812003 RepID=UPI0021A8EBD1|nr:hypothetical protein [Actinophytocola gossypii]
MRSFRALTDLIVPSRCAGCAAPGGPWCPDCARTLAGPIPVVRPALPSAHALGLYRGAPAARSSPTRNAAAASCPAPWAGRWPPAYPTSYLARRQCRRG